MPSRPGRRRPMHWPSTGHFVERIESLTADERAGVQLAFGPVVLDLAGALGAASQRARSSSLGHRRNARPGGGPRPTRRPCMIDNVGLIARLLGPRGRARQRVARAHVGTGARLRRLHPRARYVVDWLPAPTRTPPISSSGRSFDPAGVRTARSGSHAGGARGRRPRRNCAACSAASDGCRRCAGSVALVGVAFVLSGGASLGAVEVGMLAALRERGIRPDVIVGTSVGALNGAWLAGHPDAPIDDLAEVWKALHRTDVFPADAAPRSARVRGPAPEPVRRTVRCASLIERHVTFDRLEDAPIPLHVVAVEVLTGRDVLLSSGPAVDSVLASAALPALFDPVEIDGVPYMDGGVGNNTPISHAVCSSASTRSGCSAPVTRARSPSPRRARSRWRCTRSSLLLHKQLVVDVERYESEVELHVPAAAVPVDRLAGRLLAFATSSSTARTTRRRAGSTRIIPRRPGRVPGAHDITHWLTWLLPLTVATRHRRSGGRRLGQSSPSVDARHS